jgi:hypothetical protein
MSHTDPASDPTLPPGAESDELDAAWLAAPTRRSRGRIVLVTAFAVLVVFLGGVEVQKRWGPTSSPAANDARPAAFSGGALGTPPIGGSSTSGTSSTGGGASTPAVIGTLTAVHGRTWTVKDLGGTSHRVKVTTDTTLTRPLGEAWGRVRLGTAVVVEGTTHGHRVTATAITVH